MFRDRRQVGGNLLRNRLQAVQIAMQQVAGRDTQTSNLNALTELRFRFVQVSDQKPAEPPPTSA